ncbi:MAG: hypothetical protein AAGH53_04540 [Pseudomonadota bacterium]
MAAISRWIIFYLLALAALAEQAYAQRLDQNVCNNGVYHIEDAFSSVAHMAVIFNAPQQTYCSINTGSRSCINGRELVSGFRKDLKDYNIKSWRVNRIALMPELIGQDKYACQRTDNGSRLGIVIERYFSTRDGKSIRDLRFMDVEFRLVVNGNISVLGYTEYQFDDLPSAAKNAGNPFKRRQFVFDRTYGNSRKIYAAGTVEGSGPGNGSSARSGGSSGSSVFTITRSGSSGLLGSSTAASQAARSSALNAARSACQSQGGSVMSSNSVPGTTRKATDTTYRGSATATVRCRRK